MTTSHPFPPPFSRSLDPNFSKKRQWMSDLGCLPSASAWGAWGLKQAGWTKHQDNRQKAALQLVPCA